MFSYQDIRWIHLEVTDKCNAACPMCPRNISGAWTNPNLPLTELSLEDIKRILPKDMIQRLTNIFVCGN